MPFKTRKIVVIGAGHVGSHCGYSLAEQGVCDELVFIDVDKEKAASQALDIADAAAYLPHAVASRAGDYGDLADADLAVMSAGPLPTGTQTRMEMLGETVQMIRSIVPQIKASGFPGVLVSISNPADVIAHYLQKNTGLPAKRVVSTSTSLDSARLRRVISEHTGVARQSIQAYILGEHGESQAAAWSNVTVAGKPISRWMEQYPETWGRLDLPAMAEEAKQGGWVVLHGKKSTEFGIGTTLCEIAKAILHDERRVMPVSVLLEGQYGQRDVYASVPAVLGKDGVERIVELDLSPEEQAAFDASCDVMRKNFQLTESV